MRVAILTAIYDGYDSLKPTLEQEGTDVEWICVTDKMPAETHGWQIVVEPRPGQHPNVAAKRPKMLPWEYTAADYSIWIDASFQVKSDSFAGDMVYFLKLDVSGIAQFKHPWRDCVYTEAEASVALPKYAGQPIQQQVACYHAWGHPEHWGLWGTGVIAREHTPDVKLLGERWLRTCQEWSYQDQISEAVHLRLLGLRPLEIPGGHLRNPWLEYQGSGRH